MDSVRGTRALPRVGFPIRKSPDQSLLGSSPRLIAAINVLHRLLVPRHSPCALVLLIMTHRHSRTPLLPLCSFQGTGGTRPATSPRPAERCALGARLERRR